MTDKERLLALGASVDAMYAEILALRLLTGLLLADMATRDAAPRRALADLFSQIQGIAARAGGMEGASIRAALQEVEETAEQMLTAILKPPGG